jgi:peptidoglycan hydrolase-like protein with peptidoglycan-binding domain
VSDIDERAVAAHDPEETPFRRSLRASRERRATVARRRRRDSLGRRGLLVGICSLAFAATGAIAQDAGPAAVSSPTVALQKALGVAADGIIGPQTRGAILRFQRAHGLVADGIAGPATLAALGVTTPVAAPSTPAVNTATPAGSAQLANIAQCESGGNPSAISRSGQYRGKYQFDRTSWEAVGGTGDPAAATEAEQDRRAAMLMAQQGPSAWPNCSKQ